MPNAIEIIWNDIPKALAETERLAFADPDCPILVRLQQDTLLHAARQ